MHLEFLIEDRSGSRLMETLLPKLLGEPGNLHTWRIHAYKGVGRVPHNLGATADPSKRMLLDQLPRLLRGYGRTPGIDAVVLIVDADRRDCREFLTELETLLQACDPAPQRTLFRLAIEEIEAWYSLILRRFCKPIPARAAKFLIAISRIPFVELGNCWLMQYTPEGLMRSEALAGLCRAR